MHCTDNEAVGLERGGSRQLKKTLDVQLLMELMSNHTTWRGR